MNEVTKSLKEHRSIRSFNDEIITEEQINEILDCGMRGATAGNMMLYSIIKVQEKENLEWLSVKCDNQKFIATSQFALIFLADAHKFYKFFEQRKVENYEEPCLADFMLANQDGMIAAQNCVIAAESMGIGTCYIGDIMENYEAIKDGLNLPKNVMPITMVVFGNYDTIPPKRDRFNKEFVVFDEVYPNIDREFINKMFEREEKNKANFAQAFFDRKINSDFFAEMKRTIRLYIDEWKNN